MITVNPPAEKECICNIRKEEKRLVKYNFGSGGIHWFLVCTECLKDVPWNKCIVEVIKRWKNA